MKKGLYSQLFFALAIFGLAVFAACQNEYAAKTAAQISSEFQAAGSADQKTALLKKVLAAKSDNAYLAFYYLLSESKTAEESCFKKAFAAKGDADALSGMGFFVDVLTAEFKKNLPLSSSDNEEIIQAVYAKYLNPFTIKLNTLAPEIKIIAEKNSSQLVALAKKSYAEKDAKASRNIRGAIIGLQALGEPGATLLLNAVENEADENLILEVLPSFNANMVIPVLKTYENPASSEIQKHAASLMIYSFSKTDGNVIDKVVEAFKHGRYFALPTNGVDSTGKPVFKVNSIDEAMKLADSWWGNYLEDRYKGEVKVAEYIAKKYLGDTAGLESVIRLISATDFISAKPYLAALEPNKLSPDALQALFDACRGPSSLHFDNPELTKARCDLFCRVFLKCDLKKREKALYGVSEYPADMMADFYIENFKSFSSEEIKTIIYNCGKSGLHPFPEAERERVFNKIRPACDKETRSYIDFTRTQQAF
ncbi:MAG TPA: hypothetical protein VMD74_02320 [Candidatus Methylomirabilis sp.]|nr:hypothetical protein [Candidatus Methylomirabilis sp.]